jgi:transcriptional regulator GlxA family with amidase domain
MARSASILAMRIEIVVFDGFDELDAIGPFEVLRLAATEVVKDLDVGLVGELGGGEITASYGLKLTVDGGLSGDADMVIVPGGGWNDATPDAPPQGARAVVARGVLPRRLAELHEGGTRMGSVCTGAMLLDAAGLTKGRPATTHCGAIDELRAHGADIKEGYRVVDDGDLITAGGVTSGIDMALYLVEREWGERLADGIAKEMEIKRDRRVWRSHG